MSGGSNPIDSLIRDIPGTKHAATQLGMAGLMGVAPVAGYDALKKLHSGPNAQTPGIPNQLPTLGFNPVMYGGSFKMPRPTGDPYNDMAQQMAGPSYRPQIIPGSLAPSMPNPGMTAPGAIMPQMALQQPTQPKQTPMGMQPQIPNGMNLQQMLELMKRQNPYGPRF